MKVGYFSVCYGWLYFLASSQEAEQTRYLFGSSGAVTRTSHPRPVYIGRFHSRSWLTSAVSSWQDGFLHSDIICLNPWFCLQITNFVPQLSFVLTLVEAFFFLRLIHLLSSSIHLLQRLGRSACCGFRAFSWRPTLLCIQARYYYLANDFSPPDTSTGCIFFVLA